MNFVPRVSVIIPSFNCAGLVANAIESVWAQTLPEREVVVVNDGSTDNTIEALKPYMNRPDFQYFSQENQGASAARNNGIRHARGEFIFVLDADDIIPPHCLERLVETVEREGSDWATCDILRREGSNERILKFRLPRENPLAYAIDHGFALNNAFFFRRSALERVGLYDEQQRIYEDVDLNARLLRAGAPVSSIPEPLYIYMIRGTSVTKEGKRLRNLACMERFYRRHYRELAAAGNRDAARMYGQLMWRQAGNYREAGAGLRPVISCLAECFRFSPLQTLSAIKQKLLK